MKTNPIIRSNISWPLLRGWVFAACTTASTGLLLIGCGTSSSSKPVSWDMQVNAAMQAALSVDQTARLYNITAFPKEYHTPNWDYSSSPLTVQFNFDRMSGNDLMVSYVDTDMTSTLKLEEEGTSTNNRKPDDPSSQNAASVLAAVKLSPREAGVLTWSDAMVQADNREIKIFPTFGCEVLKPDAEWTITYTASHRKRIDGHDLEYIVDAKTGQILQKDYMPGNP